MAAGLPCMLPAYPRVQLVVALTTGVPLPYACVLLLPCDLLLNVGAQFQPRCIYVYLGQLHATKDHLKKITNLAVGVGG
jgi:hypothetical protein